MKTKILALALVLGALITVEASAGAIYGPNGAIVGYNHDGMFGQRTAGLVGLPGGPARWAYDCNHDYYVPVY